jgi:hypothetical protein
MYFYKYIPYYIFLIMYCYMNINSIKLKAIHCKKFFLSKTRTQIQILEVSCSTIELIRITNNFIYIYDLNLDILSILLTNKYMIFFFIKNST